MPRFANVSLETADMQRREWMDTKPQNRYAGRLKFCGPQEEEIEEEMSGVTCDNCGRELILEVLQNHSGWYLGYVCSVCGPHSRETGYFATREHAESDLAIWLDGFKRYEAYLGSIE